MLIQEFHDLIRQQDIVSARRLVAKARDLKYPGALIDYMEAGIKKSSSLTKTNPINEKLLSKELPLISANNYLLFREDLRALGFDQKQAEDHLIEYGINELTEEEQSDSYRIRRYFDLNDSQAQEFALLILHANPGDETRYTPSEQNGVSVFHASLDTPNIHVSELGRRLDIQEFAAWLYIRKKIPYLCILDESDRPVEGWLTALTTNLKSRPEVVCSEEYVACNEQPRTAKRNRQYKSQPTRFRIFTRGYVSGIFAVETRILSQLKTTETIYPSTWCLQVDILQQANTIPHIIDIPLMVRNQAVNPAILEYGDIHLRDYFRASWNSYMCLCKSNLNAISLINKDFPSHIQQGEFGELVLRPKKEIKECLVSIIIPFRDKVELLRQCISSLQKYETMISYEIILADNGSIEPRTQAYIQSLIQEQPQKISHLYIDEPFNFSRVNNLAAEQARGEFILMLNNDIEFCAPDPISQMAAYFALKEVGGVGATLLYPDLSIQHAGIVMTSFETYDTFSPYKSTREEEYDYYQIGLKSTEEWSAATAACLLVRKEIWSQLNGLDETLTVAYNDVDFCLRIRQLGQAVLSVPGLNIKHYESKSRGDDNLGEKYNRLYEEGGMLRQKHADYFSAVDPFWPKSLSVSNPRATPSCHDHPIVLRNTCESEILLRVQGLQAGNHPHYCVYVGFDPRARLRPDVLQQVRILSQSYNVIFVTTSHSDIVEDPLFTELKASTYRILIRDNVGYDFGSWRAGIVELEQEIKSCDTLLLMNDSLYGPIQSFDEVINKTLNHDSPIVCMTKNYVGGEHAQSYFVSYKQAVATSPLFMTFWKTLPIYGCKFSLIKECEINWSQSLINAGYQITALFDSGVFGNQTHISWKQLIEEQRFPFIKNELILRNPVGQNLDGMEQIMQMDADLYEQMLMYWRETYTEVLYQSQKKNNRDVDTLTESHVEK